MKNSILYAMAVAAAAMPLTGCVDSKYDLDDIDTTTRIPIDNLVIPVNLNDILLDDIIDLSGNDNIVEATDPASGKTIYALSKVGDITTDDVVIEPIHVTPDPVSSSSVTIRTVSEVLPGVAATDVVYQVEDMESTYLYAANDVDNAVESITAVTTAEDLDYKITIHIPATYNIEKMTLHNVKIQYPAGMYMADGSPAQASSGTYNPQDGVVTIEKEVVNGHSLTVNLIAQRIDLTVNDTEMLPNHRFEYRGKLGVMRAGHVVVTPASGATMDSEIKFGADYSVNNFYIKNFDGSINYSFKGVNINDILLDDLPDFLDDKQTNIFLANPQVYITATNPTADYCTSGAASIALTSQFSNGSSRTETSSEFVLGYDKGSNVDYHLMLSPDGQSTLPQPEYASNLTKFTYSGLGDILAAGNTPDGLPTRIHAELVKARFFGDAKGFPVKVPGADASTYTIPGLNGSYRLFAPLAFDPGTRVVYSKVDDGWESDDLNGLELDQLKLNAHVVTTVDAAITLIVYPLDEFGNKLGRSFPVEIPALADQDIELTVESTPGSPITKLGGVEYHAIVEDGSNDATLPLGPNETIALKDIRIKVTGSYTKEF